MKAERFLPVWMRGRGDRNVRNLRKGWENLSKWKRK
jgi:hypothetical protein